MQCVSSGELRVKADVWAVDMAGLHQLLEMVMISSDHHHRGSLPIAAGAE